MQAVSGLSIRITKIIRFRLWRYAADRKVEAAGQPKGRISCHSVQKDKDWLFTEAK
jgi:hypothetical protein